jgi:hypothetical protein
MNPDAQDLCCNKASDSPKKARKPKQPFLKRGEGVAKRLTAYKFRGSGRNESKNATSSAQDIDDQHVQRSSLQGSREVEQQQQGSNHLDIRSAAVHDAHPRRSASPGCSDELQADTFMLGQQGEAGLKRT